MTKDEIVKRLKENTEKVISLIESLSGEELNAAETGKWSKLKHLEHLLRSIQPLNKALQIPLPGLRILFGKPNRPSRTYDEQVAKYLKKLSEGGKASGRFIPAKKQEKSRILKKYQEQSEFLYKVILKWKEGDLDKYLLPHPLLGKLLIREMLYFTIYHTEHHYKIISSLNQE